MPYALLTDRSVVALSGDDTIPFLQGLITNDAALLENGTPLYTALLSPQGKFMHDFFLVPQQGRILLDIHKDREADLLGRLKIYRLRSKVNFEPLADHQVMAVWDTAQQEGIADPRLPALGRRIYGSGLVSSEPTGDYEAHRISLGIPDGAKDMQAEKSLLLEFDFEALHGVSFSKGCYVGQEVTARSKFRGQVRKQLYQVRSTAALPPSGTEVLSGGVSIGELRSTSGDTGLALLRTEEVEKKNPLTAGGVSISARRPSWAPVDQ